MKYYVLYNPYSSNNRGQYVSEQLKELMPDKEFCFFDVTKIENIKLFLKELNTDDKLVICGGDGTLNRFVNSIEGVKLKNDIYLYAGGSGNDFLNDLGRKSENFPICINQYIKNLPRVSFNGQTLRFINGIGFGIDGYVCQEGDRIRMKSHKPVNYTGIALKGLLFKYKPVNAQVTIDGKTYAFSKVWLAPTMKGRFFGGGMMIAPNQDRMNAENTVSVIIASNLNKLNILRLFPKIFKGNHIKYTKYVKVFEGNNITVEFDRPNAMQIDGETFLNVISYSVTTDEKPTAIQSIKNEVKTKIKSVKDKITQ